MGFFSWNCAVSGESIANVFADRPAEDSHVFLVLVDQVIEEKSYGGYGEFGGVDVYEWIGRQLTDDKTLDAEDLRSMGIEAYFHQNPENRPQIKLVKAKYFKGQSYNDLPESERCEFQGYFYPENDWDDE